MTNRKARIQLEEYRQQGIKLTNAEIRLIMCLRENYLTVPEFVESARVGVDIQSEASNNDYYTHYRNKVYNIYNDITDKSPLQ